MKTISNNTIQYIKNGGYESVTMSVITTDLDTFVITNSDIVAGSLSINKNSILSTSFDFGNAECAELKFTVVDPMEKFVSYKFEGAEVNVVFEINGESINGGTFYIDNKPSKTKNFSITALDKLVKLNKVYQSDLGKTATLQEIFQECCSKCGLVAKVLNNVINMDYVATVPHGEKTTYHEVVCWVAQLACANAFVDNDGYIRLGWYGEQQRATTLPVLLPVQLGAYVEIPVTGDIRYDGYESQEESTTITGVSYDDGKNPISFFGTSTTVIEISANPLIKVGDNDYIVETLFNKLNGFTYRPCQMNIVSFPHLEPMDIITVTDPNGMTFNTIISNMTFTLNGRVHLESRGKSAEEGGYANPTLRFTPSQLASIRSQAVKESTASITQYEESVLSATSALTTSHGFYETKVMDVDGKIIEYYQHDQPLLADSMIITKITEGYMGKSNDGGLTYSTTISAEGATIPQLTARVIYGDQVIVGGQGTSGELIVRDNDNDELIKLNKLGITMADGTSIIGGNGVKSTFVFSMDFSDVGCIADFETGEVREVGFGIDYFIPSNFTIESAILYLQVHPQYADSMPYVAGGSYTGWGYPRNLKVYNTSLTRRKLRFVWVHTPEIINDSNDVGTDITTACFGSSKINITVPSGIPNSTTNYAGNFISANISGSLSVGNGRIVLVPTTLASEPCDEFTVEPFKFSGQATGHLVIIGYKT